MYQIFWNEKAVGTANVVKEGLYYRFNCVCRPVTDGIHRILVSDGRKDIDLGICVPVGQDFTLDTKIPAKYFQSNRLSFRLVPKQEDKTMIPVKDGMTFLFLNKLDNACLKNVDGTQYIVIDRSPVQQGSDRNQAHPSK